MKKKNVLSLHEETEKEAAKIEKEILKDSKLEEIKVSDEMEKRLARHKVKRKCIGTVHFSEEE